MTGKKAELLSRRMIAREMGRFLTAHTQLQREESILRLRGLLSNYLYALDLKKEDEGLNGI